MSAETTEPAGPRREGAARSCPPYRLRCPHRDDDWCDRCYADVQTSGA